MRLLCCVLDPESMMHIVTAQLGEGELPCAMSCDPLTHYTLIESSYDLISNTCFQAIQTDGVALSLDIMI